MEEAEEVVEDVGPAGDGEAPADHEDAENEAGEEAEDEDAGVVGLARRAHVVAGAPRVADLTSASMACVLTGPIEASAARIAALWAGSGSSSLA